MRRPLLLTGFMATGKSTIGRRIANTSGLPFIDLDERIEAAQGLSVRELFARHGEAHFRAIERQQLEDLLRRAEPAVVALGGGALMRREVRIKALDAAVVVAL